MRVGLVIYGNLNTLSGGYLYDRRLVEHLRAHGDTVHIVSLPWRNYGRHLLDNFSRDLRRALATAPVDIWLEDELNHPSLAFLPRRKNRGGVPIVSIVHHLRSDETRPRWQNVLYRAVERAYLRRADAFIFNSRTTRDSVARVLGGTPRGIVAYPGRDRLPADISAPDIARRVRQSPPLRLLFVGNIISRKRVHILLNALAALPADCAALKLVGRTDADPRYFRQMQSLATQLRLTDRVQFLGRLPDAELTPLLCDSHLLAVPSGYEGFGIVYLEAMGFGVPVIAGMRGGAREIVTPGENGFLADDVRSVAAILRDLCENRQKLAQMSLAAQARQRQFPAWDDSMAHIRAFLLELTEVR
ncbi:MAG TPA: glycosyltransferase family 1 protein [Anaerolineae bacterium]|nr:glycosyltransferase family 1 protein [Anaerolineae bacterium]